MVLVFQINVVYFSLLQIKSSNKIKIKLREKLISKFGSKLLENPN